MEKIALGLVHYAHFRPHQGLGGPAEGPIDSPFLVDCLDAERMLTLLVRKAA